MGVCVENSAHILGIIMNLLGPTSRRNGEALSGVNWSLVARSHAAVANIERPSLSGSAPPCAGAVACRRR
jgi:hypothetical protein